MGEYAELYPWYHGGVVKLWCIFCVACCAVTLSLSITQYYGRETSSPVTAEPIARRSGGWPSQNRRLQLTGTILGVLSQSLLFVALVTNRRFNLMGIVFVMSFVISSAVIALISFGLDLGQLRRAMEDTAVCPNPPTEVTVCFFGAYKATVAMACVVGLMQVVAVIAYGGLYCCARGMDDTHAQIEEDPDMYISTGLRSLSPLTWRPIVSSIVFLNLVLVVVWLVLAMYQVGESEVTLATTNTIGNGQQPLKEHNDNRYFPRDVYNMEFIPNPFIYGGWPSRNHVLRFVGSCIGAVGTVLLLGILLSGTKSLIMNRVYSKVIGFLLVTSSSILFVAFGIDYNEMKTARDESCVDAHRCVFGEYVATVVMDFNTALFLASLWLWQYIIVRHLPKPNEVDHKHILLPDHVKGMLQQEPVGRLLGHQSGLPTTTTGDNGGTTTTTTSSIMELPIPVITSPPAVEPQAEPVLHGGASSSTSGNNKDDSLHQPHYPLVVDIPTLQKVDTLTKEKSDLESQLHLTRAELTQTSHQLTNQKRDLEDRIRILESERDETKTRLLLAEKDKEFHRELLQEKKSELHARNTELDSVKIELATKIASMPPSPSRSPPPEPQPHHPPPTLQYSPMAPSSIYGSYSSSTHQHHPTGATSPVLSPKAIHTTTETQTDQQQQQLTTVNSWDALQPSTASGTGSNGYRQQLTHIQQQQQPQGQRGGRSGPPGGEGGRGGGGPNNHHNTTSSYPNSIHSTPNSTFNNNIFSPSNSFGSAASSNSSAVGRRHNQSQAEQVSMMFDRLLDDDPMPDVDDSIEGGRGMQSPNRSFTIGVVRPSNPSTPRSGRSLIATPIDEFVGINKDFEATPLWPYVGVLLEDDIDTREGSIRATVVSVNEGGPADQSDLQVDDVLLAFNKTPIYGKTDFGHCMAQAPIDSIIVLHVYRPLSNDFLDIDIRVRGKAQTDRQSNLSRSSSPVARRWTEIEASIKDEVFN